MPGPGSVNLAVVSLFPPTYHNRPNGNRIDIMEKLAAMHPSFLRLSSSSLPGKRKAPGVPGPSVLVSWMVQARTRGGAGCCSHQDQRVATVSEAFMVR